MPIETMNHAMKPIAGLLRMAPLGRALLVGMLLTGMLLAGASPSMGQDPESSPTEPSPTNQAREAFRSVMRRVMIPKSRLTDGPQIRAAFREAISEARQATVEIRSKGKQIALGGIVGSDGWILTKASRLEGPPTCRLEDGREFDARLVGVDPDYDLAMLKIEVKELPTVAMKRHDDSDVGEWVATIALGRDPIAVGVVSVDTRPIRHRSGWLGVGLEQVERGVRITQVYPESGAAIGGALVNDIIVKVNDEKTPTREKLFRAIKKHSAGDVLKMLIQRGDEKVTIRAELTARVKGMPNSRRDFQNGLGSRLSERRASFPHALQHDTALRAIDCGGPLVDLEGRVVGFNIARAGRTESYAIPANIVVTRLYDLMSGSLAPDFQSPDEKPQDKETTKESKKKENPEEAKQQTAKQVSQN